jgi:hypothetical protein
MLPLETKFLIGVKCLGDSGAIFPIAFVITCKTPDKMRAERIVTECSLTVKSVLFREYLVKHPNRQDIWDLKCLEEFRLLGCYIPEDGILHSHRRENRKYYTALNG